MRWSFALRRSTPLGFLGMLALIWAVESFITRNDLRFSAVEADTWKSARVATDHLQTGGVLTFGDSQVELGISPISVESRLGQPVQCLAVPGGQAPSSYFLLRRALRSGAIPSAIVVDFEPHLLQRGRGPGQRMWPELADFDECLDLARTLKDSEAFASMLLARTLPSYRERLEIRSNLMTSFRGETPTNPGQMSMARRNRGMNRGGVLMAKQPPGHQHQYSQWANPSPTGWAPDPLNEAYAHRFLQLAKRHNIPVFCALMPVVPGLKEKAMASGMESAYFAWLGNLQGRYPHLFVLDWRNAGYPDSVFIDALHLDVEGSASVGLALAEYLRRCMRGENVGERWVKMPPFRIDGSQVALEDHNRSDFVVRSAAVSDSIRR